MSKEKQIEEKTCKKCLHYEMCLEKFRKAKADGFYEMTDEEEYFAHADECNFFITGYRKQNEWISVDERLPEKSGDYLTYHNGVFSTLMYSAKHRLFNATDGLSEEQCLKYNVKVSHWMPLPEAPKMRKEDEGK